MGSPRKPAAKAVPSTNTVVSQGPAFTGTLADVIEATKNDGFVYTPASFHESLVASGDVEVNKTLESAEGYFATRATPKAMNMTAETQTAPADAVATAKPTFAIETVPMPEKASRAAGGLRAGRTPVYPFDNLEVGQSFFVADKGDKKAFKSMASTVAGANARYVEEIEGETRVNRKGVTVPATKQLRKFKIFDTERTTADGVIEKGARIFRVEITADTLESAAE